MNASTIENSDWTNEGNNPLVCYAANFISMDGLWYHQDPLKYSIPLFLIQLLLIIITTNATHALLEPLRQPRYISEVIGGVLLGPTVLGQIPGVMEKMFPLRSVLVLETMAHVGLIYFIFTVGVEVELSVVRRSGGRAITFMATLTVLPTLVGAICGALVHSRTDSHVNSAAFLLFLGLSLSATAFSVLARILGELKLIGTPVGRLAVSSAMLTDGVAWTMLVISIALAQSADNVLGALWAVISGIIFFCASYLVVRPAARWVERHTPDGEELDEAYACGILIGVLVWALIADAIGTHAIFGAFTFGIMVPSGALGEALINIVEDFVTGLLLPLFFVLSGLRTDIGSINDGVAAVVLIFAVLLATASKVGGCVLVAFLYKMAPRDGLSMGLLMNTKGVIELIVLNIGFDKHVIASQTFTILVIMSVVVTAMVSPMTMAVVRPTRRMVSYKRRTVQWNKPESELQILACIHNTRNVPCVVAILDAANPTKRAPIFVHALHLVELTNRASAMLMVNNAVDGGGGGGGKDAAVHTHAPTNLGRLQAQSETIAHAFETYEQHAGGVTAQLLTAYSPYPSMHEDVCSHAEDKRVALIIIPFHKQLTVDGGMEVVHPAIRSLNQNILSAAPCSVGILVDRGFGAAGRVPAPGTAARRIVVLFFGGPDDREALAFGTRMTGHPSNRLTVLRFVPAAPSAKPSSPKQHERVLTVMGDNDRGRQLDDEQVAEFRQRSSEAEGDVSYVERAVSSTEETVGAIREMGGAHDLYIVGKTHESVLTAGLTDWSEFPELGAIGDLLVSSDFAEKVSVLVVQRSSTDNSDAADAFGMPGSPGRHVRLNVNKADHRTRNLIP